MLREVYLHGDAADKFGRMFRLDVTTLEEAGRALAAVVPGFREFAINCNFKCVAGADLDNGVELDPELLSIRLGSRAIHIMPVYEGAGGGGGGKGRSVGKLVAGLLLVGVGLFLVPAGSAVLGMSARQLVTMGIGMAFSGVSGLLAADTGSDEDDTSAQFSGSVPMAQQGSPIPVIYGKRLLTSPKAISFSVTSSDLAIPNSGSK